MADRFIDKTLGSDAAAGTEGAPWETLDKLRLSMAVGDTAFLKRGEIWTGEQLKITLVTPADEGDRMIFDAYGEGADPIVAPGEDVSTTITAVSAYEADEADRTTITAAGGGFTGSTNKFLLFATDDTNGVIKSVVSDTECRVKGDFSGATVTQLGKVYSLNALSIGNRSYMTFQGIRFTDCIGCNLGSGTAVKFLSNLIDNIYTASAGFIVEANMTDAGSSVDGNTIQNCPAGIAAIGGTGGQNFPVSNNLIDDVDADGIKFPSGIGLTIDGNTIGNGRVGEEGSQGHQDGIVIGPIASNCTIRNNTVFDMTQLIYFPVKDDASGSLTGIRVYGNVCYIKSGFGGTDAPGIFLDGRRATVEMSDIDIFSNSFGDLGGDIPPIQVLGAAGGTYADINVRNTAAWTDRTVSTTEVVTDANTQAAVDVDYSKTGGFGKYTTDGNGANSESGIANPFNGYGGKDGSTFDFTIDAESDLNNSGDPSLSSNVTVPATFEDIDGTTRAKSGETDVGAYEQAGEGPEEAVGGPYDTAAGELYMAGAATGEEYSAGMVTRQIHTAGVAAGEVNT